MEPYFAYGSNLCSVQFRTRCPSAVAVSRAILRGHRLVFPRRSTDWQRGGVAGVEPCPDAHVEGAFYHLHPSDMPALDDYEGVDLGHYTRGRVTVELPDRRTAHAWSFFAVRQPGGPFAPSIEYIQTMIRGAHEHGLSVQLIENLTGMLSATQIGI
jgi:gamma-glutamylcyclotransferase (GGCT)/AIG2-like uncharacterized protein YtfP